MATNAEVFQANLAFGQIAESKIARYLRSRGNAILPVYDIEYETGKGPRLFMPGTSELSKLVAPDLLVFGVKEIFWCECKHKTVFSWHRKSSTWQTGIDRHHYADYLRVRQQTDIPIWLMFLHSSPTPWASDLRYGCPSECPTGLFGQEIRKLDATLDHDHSNWGRHGMVYWSVDKLKLIELLEVLSV